MDKEEMITITKQEYEQLLNGAGLKMFKITCGCGNEIMLKPDADAELDSASHGYFVSTTFSSITLWQEHDVVGISCDKCKACVYTFV